MSRRTANKEAESAKQEAAKIYSCEVIRAKEYKETVFFDVTINGVSIYGCRFVEGKNGDFVSFLLIRAVMVSITVMLISSLMKLL